MIYSGTAFFAGAVLMLMLIGIVVSAILPVLNRWSRRYFIILFSILSLTILSYYIDFIISSDPNMAVVSKTLGFFEGFFHSLLVAVPTIYLLHYCKENLRNSKFFHIVSILWIIEIVLLIIAQSTTFIYYITPDNHFVRGPWFTVFTLPVILILILNIIAVLRRRNKLSKKMVAAFLFYLFPSAAALIVHIFIPIYLFVDISLALFALVMFLLILSEENHQYILQQKEIAKQRTDIRVLQMRPHFIYNSLTSIYYLCEQNPKKAQEVIMDFTTYLRKNFNAISSDYIIPFEEELAHTQAYLAVEKALHEDLLYIDFDTPHTRFRLPSLTLQPIVENAIKHGLNPDAEPLHISVKTRQTNTGTLITVEDDGMGFNPEEPGNEQPTLTNIKQRLEMMCKGELVINPREEGGTIIKVIIPF